MKLQVTGTFRTVLQVSGGTVTIGGTEGDEIELDDELAREALAQVPDQLRMKPGPRAKSKTRQVTAAGISHRGGGWYDVPGVDEPVQGKAAALAAAEEASSA